MKKYIAIIAALALLPVLAFARSYSTTGGILVLDSSNATLLNLNGTNTYPLANSTIQGFVKLATESESTNGTLTSVAVTPYGVNATIHNSTASNSTAGIIKTAPVGNSTDYATALSPGAFYDSPRSFGSYSTRLGSAGNGTQTISGIGFLPKEIHMRAHLSSKNGASFGNYVRGTQFCDYTIESGSNTVWAQDSTDIALVQSAAPVGGYATARITTVADGHFIITWSIVSGDFSAETLYFSYVCRR